jgi:hypothetical protein
MTQVSITWVDQFAPTGAGGKVKKESNSGKSRSNRHTTVP